MGEPVTIRGTSSPPKFRERFCAEFDCPLAQYEQRALEHCLYWHARLLIPLTSKWYPGFFLLDRRLIADVGFATDSHSIATEIRGYQRELRDLGRTWRLRLKLRVSGRKIIDLGHQLFGEIQSAHVG